MYRISMFDGLKFGLSPFDTPSHPVFRNIRAIKINGA
jgi:hypothetical protein